MTLLLLKLLLAPALVVGSSLAGRRWGAHVAGTLVALPIVAGPILLVTCLENGARFGARAATSALLGLVTLALFVVVFAWCSRRLRWTGSLAIAWGVCLASDLALAQFSPPSWWGLVAALAAAYVATKAMPAGARQAGAGRARARRTGAMRTGAMRAGPMRAGPMPARAMPAGGGEAGPAPVVWPWWDLPGRAVATATLVIAVTTVASVVGPGLTGVLAPFPIATSVVAAFVLAQRGSASTVQTLRGVPVGLFGFAVFCFLVSVLVVPGGVAVAFPVALVGALAGQLTLRRALNDIGRSFDASAAR